MSAEGVPIVKLMRDTTLKWACRKGDYVLWVRCTCIWHSAEKAFEIVDVWELSNGDYLTITNRMDDIPPWFTLHPTEVRDSAVPRMMQMLKEGYKVEEPLEGPNIWRVFTGDRLVWLGKSRPGLNPVNGVLSLVDCRANCLVIGETNREASFPFEWGGFNSSPGQEQADLCHRGIEAVQQLGIPRTMAADSDWSVG